jgi:hypothetical protein
MAFVFDLQYKTSRHEYCRITENREKTGLFRAFYFFGRQGVKNRFRFGTGG